MSNLALITQEQFGNLTCNFYKNQNNNVLMTREQIGLALEYKDPMVAIAKIHLRNSDRFDKFSFTKLVNGRETYFYNSKGIYEICRWSRQPKADAFIDWAWAIIDNLNNILSQKQTTQWQDTRVESKVQNTILSDTIKAFCEYAESQGSSNFKFYYKSIQELANKSVNIKDGQRDYSDINALSSQMFMFQVIIKTLRDEMAKNIPYKKAYQTVKAKVEDLSQYVQPQLQIALNQ
jgi:prophage antirepressor-like protein